MLVFQVFIEQITKYWNTLLCFLSPKYNEWVRIYLCPPKTLYTKFAKATNSCYIASFST